jgi:hypothetical protein
MFSKNTKAWCKQGVLSELHINAEAWSEKYLGLPVYVGRSRAKTFEYLKERMWKRIQGWKERFLSKAGKDVLIKACAQAIPTFAMSCFDLTKTLCDEMSTMICRFWWAQHDKENKVHWLSWEKLTRSKRDGGLGFRDLYGFNMAMLAKQAWRMLISPDSLCAQVLKAKYYPHSTILEAVPRDGMAYSFRSILRGVELLKEGLIWQIGDGANVNIWSDPWLARDGALKPITPRGQCVFTKVNELINPITGQWDEVLVRDNFLQIDVETILATPIREDFEDFFAWHYESKGIFTVKSAYKLYVQNRDGPQQSSSLSSAESFQWEKIWKLTCTPKIKQFIWRFAHNSLPLRMNIKRRGIECDTRCVCCQRLDEDGAHLFLRCKEVRKVWAELKLEEERRTLCECPDAKMVVHEMIGMGEGKSTLIACLLWCWWTRRNKLNAKDKVGDHGSLVAQVRYWASESTQYIL